MNKFYALSVGCVVLGFVLGIDVSAWDFLFMGLPVAAAKLGKSSGTCGCK